MPTRDSPFYNPPRQRPPHVPALTPAEREERGMRPVSPGATAYYSTGTGLLNSPAPRPVKVEACLTEAHPRPAGPHGAMVVFDTKRDGGRASPGIRISHFCTDGRVGYNALVNPDSKPLEHFGKKLKFYGEGYLMIPSSGNARNREPSNFRMPDIFCVRPSIMGGNLRRSQLASRISRQIEKYINTVRPLRADGEHAHVEDVYLESMYWIGNEHWQVEMSFRYY